MLLRIVSGCVVAASAILGTAYGADQNNQISSTHDWSGFYAGLNAGYGLGEAYDDAGVLNPPFPGTYDAVDGIFGGAQLGFNAQIDRVILGVEADIQASGMVHNYAFPTGVAPVSIDYFGTVRARAGVAWESIMPYMTAGLAYGRGTIDTSAVFGPMQTNDHVGWVAGAGVEYAVNESFSAKLEYLYTDLGQQDYPVFPGIGGEGLRFHSVRVGVNYGF